MIFGTAKLADELRKGNIINYNGTPTTCSIKTIYAISLICGETALYSPILITEEWLLKFGFVNKKLRIGVYDLVLVLPNSAFYNGVGFPCKYVHQLQNLYFALTQRELTF